MRRLKLKNFFKTPHICKGNLNLICYVFVIEIYKKPLFFKISLSIDLYCKIPYIDHLR